MWLRTILSFVIIIVAILYSYDSGNKLTIELEIEALDPTADKIQMYCDSGSGFSSKQSFSGYYTENFESKPNVYLFSYDVKCPGNTTQIRLDPVNAKGSISIKKITLISFFRKDIDLKTLFDTAIKPLHNISLLEYREENADIRIVSTQPDPHLLLIDEKTLSNRNKVSLIQVLATFSKLIIPLLLGICLVSIVTRKASGFQPAKNKNSYSLFYLLLLASLCMAGIMLTIYIQHANPLSYYWTSLISATTNLFGILSIILMVSVHFSHTRIIRYLFDIIAVYVAIYFLGDSLLYSLNGMHLQHGIEILAANGINKIFESLTYTGISDKILFIYLSVTVLGLFLLSVGVWKLNFFTHKYHYTLSFKTLLMVVFCCLTILASEVLVFSKQKNQRLVYDDVKSLLSYTVLREVDPGFKSTQIELNEPKTPSKSITLDIRKDVFLFVLESVRRDSITHQSTPNFLAFSNDCIPIEKTYSNGNATHYGWFSIFNAMHPLFWEKTRNNSDYSGAYPLQVFRDNGYKISIFTAKDLRYLGAHRTLFGSGLKSTELVDTDSLLIDHITDRPTRRKYGAYELDKFVTDELIQATQLSEDRSRPSLNIIFFDAVHFPYRWDPSMPDQITPYIGKGDGDVSLFMGRKLAKTNKPLIYNRYLNSVKYEDMQFGRVVRHLKETKQYDNSIIVVVSDHGQQFLEHNFLMHGATLYDEDVSIPMFIKPAQVNSLSLPNLKLASQLDLMPTLFGLLGANSVALSGFLGADLLGATSSECNGELAAVAGRQNTPYMFALMKENSKLLFNINPNAPLNSKKSISMDIVDENDSIISPLDKMNFSRLNTELEETWNCLRDIDLLFGHKPRSE